MSNRIDPRMLESIVNEVTNWGTKRKSKDEIEQFNTRMNGLNQRVQARIATELVETFPGTADVKSLKVPRNEFFAKVNKIFLDELYNERLDKDELMWALAICSTKIIVDQIL